MSNPLPPTVTPLGKLQLQLPRATLAGAADVVSLLSMTATGYIAALVQYEVAKQSPRNVATAGVVCLIGLLASWASRKLTKPTTTDTEDTGKPKTTQQAERQHALTTLASTCLADAHAMDLVQRLASRLDDDQPTVNDKKAGEVKSRPVKDILKELEERLRQDAVSALIRGSDGAV